MNKGIVIPAFNTKTTDYVECAEMLKNSIEKVMPKVDVTIITTDMLPYGDNAINSDWKLINDWQIFDASPYDYTIKLEADMYVPANIEYWFDILSVRDINVCSTIRDYRGNISNVRVYRQFIDNNKLPDVYNAITYFNKSNFASEFFQIVKDVFVNWNSYKNMVVCDNNELATTDWAYSIACHILGEENTTMPTFTDFSMVHMKQYINDLMVEDWTKELVYECTEPLKIQSFPQTYPVHYHVKKFSNELKKHYG